MSGPQAGGLTSTRSILPYVCIHSSPWNPGLSRRRYGTCRDQDPPPGCLSVALWSTETETYGQPGFYAQSAACGKLFPPWVKLLSVNEFLVLSSEPRMNYKGRILKIQRRYFFNSMNRNGTNAILTSRFSHVLGESFYMFWKICLCERFYKYHLCQRRRRNFFK